MANILIACEYSGIVSAAFRAKGHNVTSCDLLPSESGGTHYQGNVKDILYKNWDALIAFPPCQFLTHAQTWMVNKSAERQQSQDDAIEFFKELHQAAHIKFRCIENPPGAIGRKYLRPSQIVSPGMFGDDHYKKICLWLIEFPPLISTVYNYTNRPMQNHVNGRMSQNEKSKIKSRFFPLVAIAMANQWHKCLCECDNPKGSKKGKKKN